MPENVCFQNKNNHLHAPHTKFNKTGSMRCLEMLGFLENDYLHSPYTSNFSNLFDQISRLAVLWCARYAGVCDA